MKIKADRIHDLEKMGFEKAIRGYVYYPNNNSPNTRYFSNMEIDDGIIEFNLENMSCWCNDLQELELDFKNIRQSYEAFKIKYKQLEDADMIEEE